MKNTEKLMILISVVLVSLLAIGAVSAADADATVIGDDTDSGADSGLYPADRPAAPEPIEKPTVTETAGDFSKLDDDIVAAQVNHGGNLELEGDYQNAGDEDGITIKARTDEDGVPHKNLTIEGNGHTIDAQYKSNIFTIDEGMDFVIIQNLNFINAYTDDSEGGAIHTDAKLTLINVTFIDNTALHGGAIYNDNTGALDMENVIFINNTANGDKASGGAIYTTGDIVDAIEKAIFINNTADYGGAIYTDDDFILEMEKAVFVGNEALYGGAIDVAGSIIIGINNAIFVDNAATYDGGAIRTGNWYYEGEDFLTGLNNVTFIDNIAGAHGGAIYSNSTLFAINNATFTNNMVYAPSDSLVTPEGGAIYGEGLILAINNATFEENAATNALGKAGNGGAISARHVGIENATFVDNTAIIEGGAIQAEEVVLGNVTFAGNEAKYGGAIYLGDIEEYSEEPSEIVDALFVRNDADETGGAIFTNNPLTIKTSDFVRNTAIIGGAIYSNDNTNVYSSNFEENGVDEEFSFGGAIYQADGELYVGKESHNPDSEDEEPCTFTNDIAAYGSEIYVNDEVESATVKDRTEVANVEGRDSIVGAKVGKGVRFFTITSLYFEVVNNETGSVSIIGFMFNNNVDDENDDDYLMFGEKVNITIVDEDGNIIVEDDEYTIGTIYYPEFENDLANGTYHLYMVYQGNDVKKYYESEYDDIFSVVNMTAVFEELTDAGYDEGYDEGKTDGSQETMEYYENEVIPEIEADYNTIIAGKNATISNLTNETKKLNDTNKNLTAENAKLATEKDDANKALAAKNAEATQLTADKTNLQNQVNTLQGQVNTLQQQNTEASAKIKKVSAKSKVKKSKKFKITVTLSSTKVNGKYVYVAFNGKMYKAKVKNGKATITIKPSALKKLGGKTVKYQIIYDQSYKNKSVKVKK